MEALEGYWYMELQLLRWEEGEKEGGDRMAHGKK